MVHIEHRQAGEILQLQLRPDLAQGSGPVSEPAEMFSISHHIHHTSYIERTLVNRADCSRSENFLQGLVARPPQILARPSNATKEYVEEAKGLKELKQSKP